MLQFILWFGLLFPRRFERISLISDDPLSYLASSFTRAILRGNAFAVVGPSLGNYINFRIFVLLFSFFNFLQSLFPLFPGKPHHLCQPDWHLLHPFVLTNQDRIYAYKLGIFVVAGSHQFKTNYLLFLSLISFSPVAEAQIKVLQNNQQELHTDIPYSDDMLWFVVEDVFVLSLWNSKKTKPQTPYMLLTSFLRMTVNYVNINKQNPLEETCRILQVPLQQKSEIINHLLLGY